MSGDPVDVASLSRRVASAGSSWSDGRVLQAICPLSGGSSSLTFLAEWLDRDGGITATVIKVAPPGLPPTRNRDVLRQMRILRVLHDAGRVPVPEVLFADEGEPPKVPPFFGMTHVPGTSIEPLLDPVSELPSPNSLREQGLSAARTLAKLHVTDWSSTTVLREPVVALVEEVDRWSRLASTVDNLDAGVVATCKRLLLELMPASSAPVILHGDFRLGNLLTTDTKIVAVVDWEIWSLGDPRCDVAWFLLWARDARLAHAVRDAPGWPTRAELLRAYEETAGHALSDLTWFDALARFKQAATVASIASRLQRQIDSSDTNIQRAVVAAGTMLNTAIERLRSPRG